MKKRIIALLLSTVLVLFTFVSCSGSKNTAINISGAEINDGIYTYFYDHVSGNKEEFGIQGEDEAEQKVKKTHQLLREYVAVNSMAQKLGVSLSYTLKAQAASETDSRWDLFGKYYSEIGLTKQDLNKVLTNEALKSALLEYYYGENSDVKPTGRDELINAFVNKYIGIKVIAASLTTTDNLGNTVPLDQYELSTVREMFYGMRDRLNSGADIDTVYSDYNTSLDLVGTQSLETYVMTASSVGYGEDFFEKIRSLRYGTATVYEYEDTIYLAYRIDISGDDMGYFVTYESDVLEDLCLSKLEKKISSQAEKYEIVKEHSGVTKKIHEKVDAKHAEII